MLDEAMREATDGRPTVSTRADGRVTVVAIERPERRNAVDLPSGPAAITNEAAWGLKTLASGETSSGSARFKGGAGRAGPFDRAGETFDLFGFYEGKGHGFGPRRS
jgi:hypothetical protein